ncbi:MAG: hypothetical protein A2383_00960 [Candidatus Pacebacteria bacterium RIFOXYB1_FULL_39_46]|nr:MAG: hypothetical protein A2383_00960 [Candidatus Pacebacteria bacterium RIFOXYB1_FULL_39_46]
MKKIIFVIFLSMALVACGKEQNLAPETVPSAAQVEAGRALPAQPTPAYEELGVSSHHLIFQVEEGDAGVLDAMRRTLGEEPREKGTFILEMIEVESQGEVFAYDWEALLALNPIVREGDRVCMTYILGCLGEEIPEENVFIFWQPSPAAGGE